MKDSKAILKEYFGYNEFRKGQNNIIQRILNYEDIFCVMPTGFGKSICYQIPALLFDGITIVITPLISLMKDQVDSLTLCQISASYINSTLDSKNMNSILNNLKNNIYKIIYVSPERLRSDDFIRVITDIKVSQIVIDEAHCVSEWGHDFRKSYLNIKGFIKKFKKRPVVSAFTATATKEVRDDSIKLLGLNNPYIYLGDIDRKNLIINIYKEEDKLDKIRSILDKSEDESGIIYCLSRVEAEDLYKILREYNYNVGIYHGGMEDSLKESMQEDFLCEKIKVMICTNAFGMGINKSNIRFIIHSSIPKNIESYYQEIGRGGRDSNICECHLLYNREDIRRVEFLINKSTDFNLRQVALKKLQSLIDFCEESDCYKKYLVNYFQGFYVDEYCGVCSNCIKDDRVKDYTIEVQKILSTVFRTREKYGISVIVDILKGIKGPKIIDNELFNITTFGIMKGSNTSFIKAIINEMLKKNIVSLKEGTYSILKLNNNSIKVIKGIDKVYFSIKEQSTAQNKELFKELRLWRKGRAEKDRIRPYIIFSDTTLIDICNIMPKSLEELLEIRGVGEKKIDRYGKEIINIIKKY